MSGFEIAGLVLGAFPIVCSAAKQLKPVFENTKSWWKFETSFEIFTAAITTQEIAYRQVLRRLVEPLDITEKEYESLISDPNASLWHESHVQQGLQQRLQGDEYHWFMSNMVDLKTAVLELQKLLPLNQVYHLDSSSLESELYRLQTSFSNEKDRLLSRITTINDDLHNFLDRAPEAPRQRTSKSKVSFRDVQGQARQVYECLAKQWQCSCPTAHVVGIGTHTMLTPSTRGSAHSSGYMSLLLETGPHRKQLRVQIEAPVVTEVVVITPAPVKSSSTLDLGAAAGLKRQIESKKHQKSMSNAVAKNSISALAVSSLSVPSAKTEEPSRRRSILKRAKQKFQKLPSSVLGTAQPDVAPSSDASLLSAASSNSSVTMTQASTVSLDKLSLTAAPSVTSTSSQVRFAADEPPAMEVTGDAETGVKICELGTNCGTDETQKCIAMSTQRNKLTFAHESTDQDTLAACEVHKIEALLKGMSQRLERLYVGTQLALTLLSLVNSAWVPKSLQSSDIFLICSSRQGTTGKKLGRPQGPYFLSQTSQDLMRQEQASNKWHARSSLLLLGVILLELFHGEKLEQQECWEDSLDDGEPNENTTFCSAFLWTLRAKETLESFLGKDVGGNLSEAIRKCVCFDFGYDDDYGDSRLPDMVYEEVVVPLEKCCPIRPRY